MVPRAKQGVVVGSGIAAALTPMMASVVFTLEYAIGGNGAASITTVASAMVGVHVLIGIGEGIITAFTISAVLAVRPDLVHGARDLMVTGAPRHANAFVTSRGS
jgi:cobalt/nickel transport system permease protein